MTDQRPSTSRKSYTAKRSNPQPKPDDRDPSASASDNEDPNKSFVSQQAPVDLTSETDETPVLDETQVHPSPSAAQTTLTPPESFLESLQRQWRRATTELYDRIQKGDESTQTIYLQEHERSLREDIRFHTPDPHLQAYQEALATFGKAVSAYWTHR
ncbi:hypothetical protein F5H01DRAFT_331494 [Linnemannia elongata]|nr:hypothetical protein F5H01DRAFT_331494 [Linnemannia elongata]